MGLGVGNGNANRWTAVKGATGPTYSCKTTYSIEFDGLTEYGNSFPPVQSIPLLGTAGTGNFCISFWFKTPDVTGGGTNQKIWNTTASAYNWAFGLGGSGGSAGKMVLSGVPWVSDVCNFIFADNTWYHVAYSATRSGFGRWVVNGAQSDVKNIASSSALAFTSTGGSQLACNGVGAQLFEGNLTEIAFWNKAMSDAELTELYTNTAGKCYASDFSFSGNLVNYYPCFNTAGTFTNPLPDTVGGGPNFNLANMDATNVSTDTPL